LWLACAGAQTLFDEIADRRERAEFRTLWQTQDPKQRLQLAARFAGAYQRSVALRETYEIASRASVALGDDAGGISWAKRSLRLLPENPFLLSMVADVAARMGDTKLAESSAR